MQNLSVLGRRLAVYDEIDAVELFYTKRFEASHSQRQFLLSKNKCHELPFTQQDCYKYVGNRKNPQAGAATHHPNPRVPFIGVVTDIMGELVLPRFFGHCKSSSSLIVVVVVDDDSRWGETGGCHCGFVVCAAARRGSRSTNDHRQ